MIGQTLFFLIVIIAAVLLYAKLNREPGVEQCLVRESTEIHLPLRAVFDRWLLFEGYPDFMENVLKVQKLDADTLLWESTVRGNTVRWKVSVDEIVLDKRIAWTSYSIPPSSVAVSFVRLSNNRTRVEVEMHSSFNDLPPDESWLKRMKASMKTSLENCKTMLESRSVRISPRN